MMEIKKSSINMSKKTINSFLKGNANSVTCGMFYQPKAPAALKKFSKIENDK